jgi:hypothetical protein
MPQTCTSCGESFGEPQIDRARGLATCSCCGKTTQLSEASTPAEGSKGNTVALPAGMSISGEHGSTLVITRRWFRTKHLVLTAVFAAIAFGLERVWRATGPGIWLAVAVLALGWSVLQLASMFVNSTTVTATRQRLDVRHGPFPSMLYKAVSLDAAEVDQLYVAAWSRLFEVGAQLRDGRRVSLVRPLVTRAQAEYIEERLEWFVGIVDMPTPPCAPTETESEPGADT